MSQPEAHPYARGAIIADIACVIAEVSDLQVKQAALVEAAAAMQSRLSRMIHDLSCSTAGTSRPPSLPELRERLGDMRGRLEATLDKTRNSAERAAPAVEAARPPEQLPSAQETARPVRVGKALDEVPVGGPGNGIGAGESRECRHVAGAEGESAASADTAPAADEKKPKRVFPQPLPAKALELPLARPSAEIHQQPDYKPSGPAADPMDPRREAQTLSAGGGLVQDGGSKTDAPPRPASTKDRVLDLYATTLKTPKEIAQSVGVSENSAGPYISIGRTAKDPRVAIGDRARHAIRDEKVLDAYALGALTISEIDKTYRLAAGTTAKIVDMARPSGDLRVVTGDAHRSPKTPPSPVPAAASEAASKLSVQPTKPVAAPMPDGLLIRVKSIDGEVHGPFGVWRTTPEISKAIGSLATGDLYGIAKMVGPSGLPEKTILASLDLWKVCLAKIGIDLIHTKGIGVKLNRRAA